MEQIRQLKLKQILEGYYIFFLTSLFSVTNTKKPSFDELLNI